MCIFNRLKPIFSGKKKGFTLIEMLIVIAIIGILAAIALPSYLAHIQKANRVAAQLVLTKMAQQFERISARQGVYPASSSSSTDTYTYKSETTDTTFTITATPKGSSAEDECGVLTITQTGETTSSSSSDCW